MLLNNSSWTFLPDPCPEASLGGKEFAAVSATPPQLAACAPADFLVPKAG
jgi:hypothetical protein